MQVRLLPTVALAKMAFNCIKINVLSAKISLITVLIALLIQIQLQLLARDVPMASIYMMENANFVQQS